MEHLERAKKLLNIQCVNLKECKTIVADSIDVTTLDMAETKTQNFRKIVEVEESETQQEDDAREYRFIYAVGARIIRAQDESESQEEDFVPLIEVMAIFSARYFSEEQVSEEELSAFAEENVGYHVWPYWREFVQSMCARIDLSPPIKVPFYFVTNTAEED